MDNSKLAFPLGLAIQHLERLLAEGKVSPGHTLCWWQGGALRPIYGVTPVHEPGAALVLHGDAGDRDSRPWRLGEFLDLLRRLLAEDEIDDFYVPVDVPEPPPVPDDPEVYVPARRLLARGDQVAFVSLVGYTEEE
jgi:hypothetical protein